MTILETERLSLRTWKQDDLSNLLELCSDPEVMRYFPNTLDEQGTKAFLKRLMEMYDKHGYTYFAAEQKDTGAFVGFIGLAYQDYASPCTPAIDIGWRLLPEAWGNGFATEGAKACLAFGFQAKKLDTIVSVCSTTNVASERVMQRIGMTKGGAFKHPMLEGYAELQECLWYAVNR